VTAVRAAAREDIPAIAELLARAAAPAVHLDLDRLERQLDLVLFRHPWIDPTVPSLVAEDDTGKLQGFLGVMPRPMQVARRAVRAAVIVRLTVRPETREFVGTRLLRRCLDGPQDLSVMDSGGCALRAVWERLGGVAALGYALSWTRPLRPAAWTMTRVAPRLGRAAGVARPLTRVVDAVLGFVPRSPLRLPDPGYASRAVSVEELLACMDEVGAADLRPTYDATTLRWMLARAGERLGAPLAPMAVHGPTGAVRGWFLVASPPGGIAHVAQMAARAGAADDVVKEIVRGTFAHGCIVVRGRVDPRFAQDLTDRGAFLHARAASTLVHARDEALVRHVDRGRAQLGPLIGDLL
jgi:hypothetical protein